jgi:hypothetical protein
MSRNRVAGGLSWMLAELAVASCETILQRSSMIARGRCSDAEYRRMVLEKLSAARKSGLAFGLRLDPVAALEPWHAAATRNAKRLRRRRSWK